MSAAGRFFLGIALDLEHAMVADDAQTAFIGAGGPVAAALFIENLCADLTADFSFLNVQFRDVLHDLWMERVQE